MTAYTVEEFLAQGGKIQHIQAEPDQKINTTNAKQQLTALLQTGAKHIDELAEALGGYNQVKGAYLYMRKLKINIIMRNGWLALDEDDFDNKEIIIKDSKKREQKFTESQISTAIGRYYLQGKHLIAVNNFYWTGYECDIFAITKGLRPIEFEIKTSRKDFLDDAKKAKWQRPITVWKHYYIMPYHIYKADLLEALPHPNSGILLLTRIGDNIYISERKKAIANNNVKLVDAKQMVDICRLITARYWRTVA